MASTQQSNDDYKRDDARVHIQTSKGVLPGQLLKPYPTVILPIPRTSPYSPDNSNWSAVASAVPADGATTGTHEGYPLQGGVAAAGHPTHDTSAIIFQFPSLNITTLGTWRLKINITRLNYDNRQDAEVVGQVWTRNIEVKESLEPSDTTRLTNDERQFLVTNDLEVDDQ